MTIEAARRQAMLGRASLLPPAGKARQTALHHLFNGIQEAWMAELLFHPAFGRAVVESPSRLVDDALAALDGAITAIEGSGVLPQSPSLEDRLSLCRATRELLTVVDREAFGSSQRVLDAITKFMLEVHALLLVAGKLQLNAEASL